MGGSRRDIFRGLAKLVAVVVAAAAAGAGAGLGLSTLTGDSAATPAAPPEAALASSSPPPSTTTSSPPVASTDGANTPRVSVLSATLTPKGTPDGAARLVVRVRVTNRSAATLNPKRPVLLSGKARVPLTTPTSARKPVLLRPVAPGASATGELRFATAGAVAKRLSEQRRARLGIANRTVNVRIRVNFPTGTQAPGAAPTPGATTPAPGASTTAPGTGTTPKSTAPTHGATTTTPRGTTTTP